MPAVYFVEVTRRVRSSDASVVAWVKSMQTTIYLIRHAEAQVNINPLLQSEEDDLTEKGYQQARLVAARFKEIPVESIYTSKIPRARLTADEIGKTLSKTPIIIESLKERKVIYTNAREYIHEETFDDLKIRLTETRHFLEELSPGQVIIVSHALYLRALIAFIAFGELLTEELLQRTTDVLLVGHAAVSVIAYNKEKARWHIESWNDQQHLS